ncbi:HEPN domain-containing protein [Kitasatospora terrestris]|uniref:RiboL-PSP-HEPN domain-containing protein n=1 Tax=Kitasatospora terrestris TaxID=258051 RepID=A0ABP9DQH7_9ACTN
MRNQWPPWPIPSLKESLDSLTSSVAERPKGRSDDEHIWLTRFLVIRSCGYLEQVTYETARAFVADKSFGLVRTFALTWLSRTRNPSPDNMMELLGRFDGALSDEFKVLLEEDDQRLYREISLLVDRRHKIAHGLNEGMNSAKAVALRSDVDIVADWFIEKLDPR